MSREVSDALDSAIEALHRMKSAASENRRDTAAEFLEAARESESYIRLAVNAALKPLTSASGRPQYRQRLK